MENDKPKLTDEEILDLKLKIAEKWVDPVERIETIFNVRNSRGELLPYKVPEPQKKIMRDGILGKARKQIKEGISYISVTNKGRQMGFSVINAVEAILIAEDFPNSNIYYVATEIGQASDWMQKMNQLIEDANHWPEELGGSPMLNVISIKKIFEKCINNTYIVGLAANPSAIRGKTGIAVYFDEAAWALRTKDIARETWKALSYIISQGGQARIQSTPRTSDNQEFFWGMYQKAKEKKGGLVHYECPVIENWQDLDLTEPLYIELNDKNREMLQLEPLSPIKKQELIDYYRKNPLFEITDDYIKQPAKVLYPWKKLQELENDRSKDYQQFMQEYLCQPIDEALKVIQSEWIEQNIVQEPQYTDRGDSKNPFQICCDFAREKDYSAFIVTEKTIEKGLPVFYQRKVVLSQNPYYEQANIILDLYNKFKPDYISVDATGVGVSVSEQLEKLFVDNGLNARIIKKVTFNSSIVEQMAEGFKALCTPKPQFQERIEVGKDDNDKPIYDYTYKNQYRFLREKGNKEHLEAINHIKRVEKENLPTNTKYSGKKYGRDDAFFAAAQLCLYEKTISAPKAAFGRTSAFSQTISSRTEQKTPGQTFIFNANKKRFETKLESKNEEKQRFQEQKSLLEQRKYTKNLKFAYDCLRNTKLVCSAQKRIVNPIECTNPDECCSDKCNSYKYVKEISDKYDVKIDDLFRLFQKFYK